MRTAALLMGVVLGAACAHQSQPSEPSKSASSSSAPVAASTAPLTLGEPVPPESVPDPVAGVPGLARREPPPPITADASIGTLDTAEVPADHAVPPPAATLAPATVAEPEAIIVTGPPPPPPPKLSKGELALRERVQRALAEDKKLSFTAKRVRVEVDRNDVTVVGGVRTAHEKSEVEAVIQKVSGVRRVKNQLAVVDQPARAPAGTAP